MRKQNFFQKALLLALPVTMAVSVVLAQTTSKMPGVKTTQAAEAKKNQISAKQTANNIAPSSGVKGERSCYKGDKSKGNIITQAMLKKMPKDRQEFVKANPQRFTIVN